MWFFQKKYNVYTDGSFKQGRGSWAFVIVLSNGKVKLEASGSARKTSSNQMEIQAAIEALRGLPHRSQVAMHTDSRILIRAMTESTPRNVPILWEAALQELRSLCQNKKVTWQWVKAHAGNTFNERCDQLCITERRLPPNNRKI
jgi:ribonuclease HI